VSWRCVSVEFGDVECCVWSVFVVGFFWFNGGFIFFWGYLFCFVCFFWRYCLLVVLVIVVCGDGGAGS